MFKAWCESMGENLVNGFDSLCNGDIVDGVVDLTVGVGQVVATTAAVGVVVATVANPAAIATVATAAAMSGSNYIHKNGKFYKIK